MAISAFSGIKETPNHLTKHKWSLIVANKGEVDSFPFQVQYFLKDSNNETTQLNLVSDFSWIAPGAPPYHFDVNFFQLENMSGDFQLTASIAKPKGNLDLNENNIL